MAAFYLPVRHGMREEAQVHWHVDDLLHREQAIGKQLLAGVKRVAGRVEELNNLLIVHQGELAAMRGQQTWETLLEGSEIGFDLPADVLVHRRP